MQFSDSARLYLSVTTYLQPEGRMCMPCRVQGHRAGNLRYGYDEAVEVACRRREFQGLGCSGRGMRYFVRRVNGGRLLQGSG